MKKRLGKVFIKAIFPLAFILLWFPFAVQGNGLLEETFVKEIPCGDLLAKISLLESCQELEEFFLQWEPRAEQGDPLAMTLIGLKFYQHDPTRKKAPDYFISAAQQDFGPAQMELGMLYEKGDCLPKDDLQAFLWYALAAQNGEEKAAVSLEKLKGRMNAKNLAVAQEMVENWRPCPFLPKPVAEGKAKD